MQDWSIISSAAGTIPAAIIADTASPAVLILLKSASSVLIARGNGVRRTVIFVATPKLPSEPTNTPTRSGPPPPGSPPGLPSSTSEHEEHGAFVGERPTRQASPRAARHEGHAERREQPHDGNDFFSGTGKHNEIGNAAVSRKTIHRVGQAFRTRLAHVLLADNCG